MKNLPWPQGSSHGTWVWAIWWIALTLNNDSSTTIENTENYMHKYMNQMSKSFKSKALAVNSFDQIDPSYWDTDLEHNLTFKN